MNAIKTGLAVLKTTISAKTKKILAQLGDVRGMVISDNAEWVQHVGFISRPSEPEPGKLAATACSITSGTHDVVFASSDERGRELQGELGPGETILYAAGKDGKSQGRVLLKDNGTVALYTSKGNAKDGDPVTIQTNADGTIHLGSSFGGISITADGIKIAHVSGAAIQLDGDGVTIIGSKINVNGGQVSLGAGALPVQGVVWGPAGISGVGSKSVFVAL